jgi:hypothetical protein
MDTLTLCCLLLAVLWSGQATSKPTTPDPDVRRVCVEGLDVRVGDSFDKVSAIIPLTPHPNGPSRNADWAKGKNTDFHSPEGPRRALADGMGELRSSVYATFDARRRLRSLTLDWTYDGERTTGARDAVMKALLNQIHTCLSRQTLRDRDGWKVARIDFGTYSQELAFDTVDPKQWLIRYTISEEP